MDYAFSFIVKNGGLHKEEEYPYIMSEGTCDEKKDVSERVTISGYHDVPRNNENSFLKALANQPISVAIDASGRDFQFYSGHTHQPMSLISSYPTIKESTEEHDMGDEYLTEGFVIEKEQHQLLVKEEALRETLKEQARAEREWDERIKQE
uniref:Cysteine protease XCP2 n=1 Tax=Tanacetum cinerariifolium TaxID=118510 RepID=A0A6L2NWJ3_TANCI|nr:cysteine protease XCP2 [Tanacetum cinerariifolium]